jgi:hypothetical protein
MKMIFGCGIVITLSILAIQAATFGQPPQNPFPGPGQGPGAMPPGVAVLFVSGGCAICFAALIGFIGACMCCASPDRIAHRWALTAILMLVGVFLVSCAGLGVVGIAADAAKKGGGGPGPQQVAALGIGFVLVAAVGVLVFLVSFIFWMMFHAAVGRALGNTSLVHQSYWYIGLPFVQMLLGFALGAIIGFRTAQGSEPGPIGMGMFSAFQMMMGLIANAWYLSICWQTFRSMDLAGGPRRA